MFPPVLNIVGCPTADQAKADPIKDPALLAESKNHYWVEYGESLSSADPTFRNAVIGESFASVQNRFNEVPDSLRHKVIIKLTAEKFGEASSAFGSGLEILTVLDKTFIAASLVGKPLSVGHFISSAPSGGLAFSTIIHSYSPYILIGQNDNNIEDDELVLGTEFQEILTNFPLGSQFLTGLFLETSIMGPNGISETYDRTLVDRIGYDARRNGGEVSVGSENANFPAISIFDSITVNVLPGLQSPEAILQQQDRITVLRNELGNIQSLIGTIPPTGPETVEQQELFTRLVHISRLSIIANAESIVMAFAGAADTTLKQLEKGYLSKAVHRSPRLIVAMLSNGVSNPVFKLDIQRNDIRVIPSPGQASDVGFKFEVTRGILESVLEGEILSKLTGSEGLSFDSIFSQITDPQDLRFVTDIQQLQLLAISDVAKARISDAIEHGKGIITPKNMINVNGQQTITWLEIDLKTGHTLSVMEDGGHQALIEYLQLLDYLGFFGIVPSAAGDVEPLTFIGRLHGFADTSLAFIGELLGEVNSGQPFEQAVKNAKTKAIARMNLIRAFFVQAGPAGNFGDGFENGIEDGIAWINRNLPADPRVFRFLSSDLVPSPGSISPGAQPGINLNISPDNFFTEMAGDSAIPSVYKLEIQNTGNVSDVFSINLLSEMGIYEIQSSVQEIAIGPGQTAEIGICLRRVNGIDAPGIQVPFTATVTSKSGGCCVSNAIGRAPMARMP